MNAEKPYLTCPPPWFFLPNSLDPSAVGTFPPTDWQDPDWNPDDLPHILNYLSTAPVIDWGFTPPVSCCLCDELFTTASVWRWDGCWLWSDLVPHFIESHAVRPPEGMVWQIRSRVYMPPSQDDIDAEAGRRVHQRMWASILPSEE